MELKKTLKKENRYLNNQEGFTLIEIIAVLVILSILAVVAVPKYFDLQEEAANKALQAAMAEAIGRVNGHFAEALLGGSAWNQIVYNGTTLGTNMGDFTLSVSATTDQITLTVTPHEGTAVSNYTIDPRTIDKPGGV